MDSIDALSVKLSDYLDSVQVEQVNKAFEFANEAHMGQFRAGGDPYVSHPIAVASILSSYHMDEDSLSAAMLHDVIEDCLDKVPTRYDLIVLAAKRARQLATGGRRATLEWENDKATVMALREIEAGTVTQDNINELTVDIADLEDEFSEELAAEDLPEE